MLTKGARSSNIIEMKAWSPKGIARVFLVPAVVATSTLFWAGCPSENRSQKPSPEGNETSQSPLPAQTPVSIVYDNTPLPGHPIDPQVIDRLMEQNLREFRAELAGSIPIPDKIDYERVKFLFQQSLLESEKNSPQYKYQFLCDESEKLIYRCNRMTGEIECYSNRNDKLKILSSIK